VIDLPPSDAQIEFMIALKDQLRLTTPMLDRHCSDTFGRPFAKLDRRQMSKLIDELKTWEATPAHLQRAMGQMDLFGSPS
jgi:hypothetical protein